MKTRNKNSCKLIAYLLSVIMVFTMMPSIAFATTGGGSGQDNGSSDSLKTYVTIANKGEFVTAKDNQTKVINQEVTVTDKDNDGQYTLNDVFISAHDQFYNGGATAGYAGGDSVSKLWGYSTTGVGYYQNNKSSWSPMDSVTSGDSVYAYIYKDTNKWSDKYSYFDKSTVSVEGGVATEITLKNATFDTSYQQSDVAYKNATITVNGQETPYITDGNGKATIYFDKAGTYLISAKGADSDILVPPFCTATVTGDDASAQDIVNSDKESLNINTNNLTTDLVLPTKGNSGKTLITWQTDNANVITADGKITKDTEVKTAKLTATITYGQTSDTKDFEVSVAALTNEDVLNNAAALLGDGSSIELVEFTGETDYGYEYNSEAKDVNISTKINEAISGQFSGVNASIKTEFTGNDGFEQNGTIKYSSAKQTAQIPIELSLGDKKKEVTLTITIPKHAKTKAEAVAELKEQITLEKILNGQEWNAIKDKLVLPAGESTGLAANWASDSDAFVIENGTTSYQGVTTKNHKIVRPAYNEADASVTLTVNFAYVYANYGMCDAGPMPQDATMTFNVKVAAITKDEYDSAKTEIDGLLNSFNTDTIVYFADKSQKADLSGIKENIFLPNLYTSENGVKTNWTSDNTSLISNPSSGYGKATVTRPEKGQSDATCNLKLTLSKNSYTANKEIPVTVKAVTDEDIQAEQAKIQEIADALTFEAIKNKNTSADYVTSQLNLWRSASKENGEIKWAKSANPATGYAIDWEYTDNVKQYGNITRGENDVAVNLKATVKSADKPYTTPVNVTIPMTILGQGETPQSKYIKQLNPIMENIAASYKDNAGEWVVMDMAAYEKYNPQTTNKTTDEARKTYLNTTIDSLTGANVNVGGRSKAEIIFRSLGYDTTQIYKINDNKPINNAAQLKQAEITSHYDAPWVLLADIQGQLQLSDEQKSKILEVLKTAQDTEGKYSYSWGGDTFADYDTTATVVTALAKMYNSSADAKAIVDKAIGALSKAQGTNGSYGSANTDAMVLIALSSMGIDPASDSRFIKNGKSVIDGLLSYANDNKDGFLNSGEANALATEQGFRALIAAAQVLKSGSAYNIYDFSGNTVEPVRATGAGEITKPAQPTGDNITVSMTIKTDTEYWMNNQSVTIPGTGATVYHALKKAADDAHITLEGAESGYVKYMTKDGQKLGEFDKGENSGWMYKVNGETPNVGLTSKSILNGDNIVWFYTTDWKKEPGSEQWTTPVNPDSGGSDAEKVTTSDGAEKVTTSPTEVDVKGDTATATVTDDNAAELVKQAGEKKSDEIVIKVEASATGKASEIKAELSASTVEDIVDKTGAVLTVKTAEGEVTMDRTSLEGIAKSSINKGSKKVSITVAKRTVSDEEKTKYGKDLFSIEVILSFDGGIQRRTSGTVTAAEDTTAELGGGNVTIKVPLGADAPDKLYAARENADGSLIGINGEIKKKEGKAYYEFTTKTLGRFLFAKEQLADKTEGEEATDKQEQEITVSKDKITKRYGAKAFNLGVKANTALSYKSSNTKVVTVDAQGKVRIKGAGSAKITISAAESDTYKAAEKIVTIKVNKAKQTIKIKKNARSIKRAAVAKKARTYTFTTTGKKTALKAVKLTKAQKKAIKSVKISGNKVKVTVKKGAKKGTYKLKVYAAQNKNYKASAKKVITIRVK